MTVGEAKLYAPVFLVPLILILIIPYYYLWREQFTTETIRYHLEARDALTLIDIIFGMLLLGFGIIAHESLHGAGWSMHAKAGWRSIEFDITWKYLTPCCHCSEPLLLDRYRFGTVLPAFVPGFLPCIIALLVGNLVLMAFDFCFHL